MVHYTGFPLVIVMTVPAGSQGDFFADVRRFFSLLDLDGDGLVSYGEATLGLHHCFDAVHRVRSPSSSQHSPSPPASLPSVTASHKARVVSEQVQWLFSASAPAVPAASPAASPSSSPSPSSPAPLSFPSFESCYRRLLSSGYEQEVLWLDLVRAITALSSSAHWQSMSAVCSRARRVWAERLQQGSRQEAERRRVSARIAQSLSQQAHSAQLTSALQAMQAEGQQWTEERWMRAWHDLLRAAGDEVDYTQLIATLDEELSSTAPTSSSDSSNSNHANHTSAG